MASKRFCLSLLFYILLENSLKHEGHNVGIQARYSDDERYSESELRTALDDRVYLHPVQYVKTAATLPFSLSTAFRVMTSIRVLEVIQLVVVTVKMLRLIARLTGTLHDQGMFTESTPMRSMC